MIQESLTKHLEALDKLKDLFQFFGAEHPRAEIEMTSIVSQCTGNIHYQLRKFFADLVKTSDPMVFDFMVKYSNDSFWAEIITESHGDSADIPELLTTQAFRYNFKETAKDIYEEIVVPTAQRILLEKTSSTKKALAILALYGHKYLIDRDPMILRISAPFKTGSESRGKRPTLPQKDLALLVYNSDQIEGGETEDALVFYNNDWKLYDTSETRAKIIRKDCLINECLNRGIYESRDVFLPVEALKPQWQKTFCEKIQEFCNRENMGLFYNKSESVEKFKVCSEAFAGVKTPQLFYRYFTSHRFCRWIVESEEYKNFVNSILSNPSSGSHKVFTQMTTNEKISI